MGFAIWLQGTFAGDKFTAQKGLKYIKRDYKGSSSEASFDSIFLDLALDKIESEGRFLTIEEVERIAHRARIQARHNSRERPSSNQIPQNIERSENKITKDSKPRTIETLPKETYDRLDKQMQILKTTTNPLLSEHELRTVRNMKLKTTQETILKIVQELETQSKRRNISQEQERAYNLEINRWTKLAQKLHDRLNLRITSLEFKDYVNNFDHSFQDTRNQSKH